MEDSLKQALLDFEHFLAGTRAPALVSHSLATVVGQDVRVVAGAVARWTYANHPGADRFSALHAARNKVFDVFFYRVVRFQRIYDFFPPFERALVRAVPVEDQPRVAKLLEQYPWREIRPLGSFRDPQEFGLEGRAEATVSTEKFNEDLYRNATHQVLSADRRYTFDSEDDRERIGEAQSKISGVFDDFVELISDPRLKQEIKLANAADRDTVYASRSRFQVEVYLCQLADLAIALHNDDFFEHAAKIFRALDQLADASGVRPSQLHRFQEKTALFNQVKMAEYGATRIGTFLLRDILRLFVRWHPEKLLQLLETSEERRERKLALSMLDAYGSDVFEMLVDALAGASASTPWYYTRNLIYMLGRVTTREAELRARAVELVASHVVPGNTRQVNQQAVQALGQIASEASASALVSRLADFEPLYGRDRDATDIAHRIVSAIVGTEIESALETAFAFCERHEILEQFRDQFKKVNMPPRLREEVVARVGREIKKLRFSFSLLGDKLTTREILEAVGNGGTPEVVAVCDEILSTFPARSELAQAARRVKETPAPLPLLASDRTLHRFLASRDLAQVLCYGNEAGISARLSVETKDGIAGEIEMVDGEVVHAAVPSYFIAGDNAFEWILLVDGRDLGRLDYTPSPAPPVPRSTNAPTRDLLRDALFQRSGIEQMLDDFLVPDARYRKREVPAYHARFANVENGDAVRAVWNAIDGDPDLKTLQLTTRLSRYEVCRALFYLVRRQMVETVDASLADTTAATLDEALSSIAHAVAQIEARPVNFQSYFAAAEACAYLRRKLEDETLKASSRALRNFFLDAYTAHRVFVAKHIELCTMTLGLMSRYSRTRAESERRELLDFIAFSFGEVVDVPPPELQPRNELEQIERVEATSDPFDALGGLVGELPLDEVLAAVDDLVENIGGARATAGDRGLTQHDESTLADLFGNIANAYAKPYKDFVRELEANHKAGRNTTADWVDFALPSVKLLADATSKMEYHKPAGVLQHVVATMEEQRAQLPEESALPKLFCERMLVDHYHLTKMLPQTFSLALTADELESRKEGLIVKFILRQLPEVDQVAMNKIIFAGLGSFDRFMEIPAEEIAQVTGISKALAEKIYMKFFQYRDLFYQHDDPAKAAKLVQLFDISLGILTEIHIEVERLSREERGRPETATGRKRGLVADRQRTLYSLFALLCIKGEHELVERIQMSVFEERLRLLNDYLAAIAEASTVATA